ncbi:hypothetical protein SAMN05444267_101455 [Chryseobacterium polytrichastri]|uniref:Uncharacterized protein n=2 Tax=Chryseobacterium polytrichastri TaxID=1302687 RepID=A0A1M6YXZ3_9FLAO|nr:hypothetical protein SAMN05444267_101455 [Chryseobacterium polytrichastri]
MMWKDNFPVAFSYKKGYMPEKITLQTNYKTGTKNISELIIADSLNHQQKYILEIEENNYNIYRIK